MNEQARRTLIKAVKQFDTGCALMRLEQATASSSCNSLTEVATSVGFSEDEAKGIMDGWDTASGGYPLFKQCPSMPSFDSYSKGYAFGMELFEMPGIRRRMRRMKVGA